MRLDFHGASVRAARERIRAELGGRCPDSRLDDARLVMSELVANALTHARPLKDDTIAVSWVLQDDALRLSVTDGGSPVSDPAPRAASGLATGGRGLGIVGTLAQRWGVESADDATTVWAELPLA